MPEFKEELESLEDVPQEQHFMYEQTEDGIFKFKMPTPPEDVTNLKSALQKEREARKEKERELKRIEDENKRKSQATLEENEEWKKLAEERKNDLASLKQQLEEGEKKRVADNIVTQLVPMPEDDEKKGEAIDKRDLLKERVLKNLSYEGDTVIVGGIPEVDTPEKLQEYYKTKFPYLVGINQAKGGNAPGNNNDRGSANVKTQDEINAMNPVEKMKFFREGGVVKTE